MSEIIPEWLLKKAELDIAFDKLVIDWNLNEITFEEYQKQMKTLRRKYGQLRRRLGK